MLRKQNPPCTCHFPSHCPSHFSAKRGSNMGQTLQWSKPHALGQSATLHLWANNRLSLFPSACSVWEWGRTWLAQTSLLLSCVAKAFRPHEGSYALALSRLITLKVHLSLVVRMLKRTESILWFCENHSFSFTITNWQPPLKDRTSIAAQCMTRPWGNTLCALRGGYFGRRGGLLMNAWVRELHIVLFGGCCWPCVAPLSAVLVHSLLFTSPTNARAVEYHTSNLKCYLNTDPTIIATWHLQDTAKPFEGSSSNAGDSTFYSRQNRFPTYCTWFWITLLTAVPGSKRFDPECLWAKS